MSVPTGDLIIVTGMTGAGRSTAAKALEDLGWFVIDNLPPSMLPDVVKMLNAEASSTDADPDGIKLAVVVDVRSRGFFADLRGAIATIAELGANPRILFLEASNEVLVRRQEAARRPHPLQGGARLLDGIAREREMVRDLRGEADVLIDTSSLNVHQLADKVFIAFAEGDLPAMRATVVSFGFKYGIPVDADMVLDMRFLPNPYWVPELRDHTGLEADVSDYVLGQPAAVEFIERLEALLQTVDDGFLRERKQYLNLAIGCTGGKHRSVAMAEELGKRLTERGIETTVVHRDLGRE
jgi:RNase adapter protein RapZ